MKLYIIINILLGGIFSSNSKKNLTFNENQDWMKNLPDYLTLSQISIPGTHDTMSFYGGRLVQTQILPLSDQLNHGIRALDIRCRHVANSCAVHHGVIFQKTYLKKVLLTVTNFLNTYKTEFIFIRIKNECEIGQVPNSQKSLSKCYDGEKNTRTLQETINAQLSLFPQFILKNVSKIPTIGEVRGKILILDDLAGGAFGLRWNRCPRCLQDKYHIPTIFNIEEKWANVKNHMERTSSDNVSDNLYINFLSGSSPGAWPNAVSKKVNIRFIEELRKNNLKYKKLGIIMMDFPIPEQIMLIIQNNFNSISKHVRVYKDKNRRGESKLFSISPMAKCIVLGYWDQHIKSIDTLDNCIVLYDGKCSGAKLHVIGVHESLDSLKWNNRISSIGIC